MPAAYDKYGYNIKTNFNKFGKHRYGMQAYSKEKDDYKFFQGDLMLEDVLNQYSLEKSICGWEETKINLNKGNSRTYLFYNQQNKECEFISLIPNTDKWDKFHHINYKSIIYHFRDTHFQMTNDDYQTVPYLNLSAENQALFNLIILKECKVAIYETMFEKYKDNEPPVIIKKFLENKTNTWIEVNKISINEQNNEQDYE